ncbi:MAG TPA: EamA family transporter [Candidatus Bathyarchaeia archaeon]|nr:EamA family transporter [Candidatus Bathyarchaeia archaeon]
MAVEWFYFALLSSLLISGVNIVDKILISDFKIPPLVYVLVISATSLMPLVTLLFFPLTTLSIGVVLFTIVVGFVRIYYTLPYFQALTIEEVSRVVPVLQLTPVFVLILSSLFLQEALRPQDYVAFVLLVLGGTLFAIRLSKGIRISLAFYLMIISSFMLAVYSVALKYLFSTQDFYTIFIWVQVAGFLAFFQMLSFKPLRGSLVSTYKTTSRRIGVILVAEQAVAYISVFAYSYAIAHGPVALISSVSATQPLFVLLFATLLSYRFPRVLKEELTRTDLFLKGLGLVAIFAGIYLIQIFGTSVK